jgi:hypothetical protein
MKSIKLKGQTLNYIIRRHKRAKRLRLTIGRDKQIVLTLPCGVSEMTGRRFMRQKADWITRTFENVGSLGSPTASGHDYRKDKEKARAFVLRRLEYYNRFYRFQFNRVSIRDQKTRWGSCSAKSNLNFSYKLLYLPLELADYVIVHELCHLQEMNHSDRFWRLVEKVLPDYQVQRKRLKKV